MPLIMTYGAEGDFAAAESVVLHQLRGYRHGGHAAVSGDVQHQTGQDVAGVDGLSHGSG